MLLFYGYFCEGWCIVCTFKSNMLIISCTFIFYSSSANAAGFLLIWFYQQLFNLLLRISGTFTFMGWKHFLCNCKLKVLIFVILIFYPSLATVVGFMLMRFSQQLCVYCRWKMWEAYNLLVGDEKVGLGLLLKYFLRPFVAKLLFDDTRQEEIYSGGGGLYHANYHLTLNWNAVCFAWFLLY